MFLIQSVSFGPDYLLCVYVDSLVSDFDFHIGVGLEVVIPVGVGVGSSLRSEDQVAVAVLEIHNRVDPGFSGPGSLVIDK